MNQPEAKTSVKRTKSQMRRANENAYAFTIRRAMRRFIVNCPYAYKQWPTFLALVIFLLWIPFAILNKASSLDSLFAGWAFVGLLATIMLQLRQIQQQRDKDEEEKACRLRREELNEAYRLIDQAYTRIQNFVLTSTMRKACENVPTNIQEDTNEYPALHGIFAFSFIWERISEYLNYLYSDSHDKEEMVERTIVLYQWLNIVKGVSVMFSRAVGYTLHETRSIDEKNKLELMLNLFSSNVNEVEFVVITSLEGDPYFPSSHDYISQFTVIPCLFSNQPNRAQLAFIHALRARHRRPCNVEQIVCEMMELMTTGRSSAEV